MKLLRPITFVVIFLAGLALIAMLYFRKVETPLESSLAPFFQIMGEPVKAIDIATTKVLPINEFDEKEYGDCIASHYSHRADSSDSNFIYLNSLLKTLAPFSTKPFTYRAFVMPWPDPNACALPGGIILVTDGLLDILETEGELVSVLAHEMGHIECGHCFGAVKFEVLTKKIDASSWGMIADFLNTIFFRHAYSKTQEAEADAFAYNTIIRTTYTPSSVAGSFVVLQHFAKSRDGTSSSEQSADILRDYFMSHPPLQLRAAKYDADARRWWATNTRAKKYNGRKNLRNRVVFSTKAWDEEWTTAAQVF